MDASPNQLSEVEFEQLLFAASQSNRNFPVLTGGKELRASMPNDANQSDEIRDRFVKE